MGGIKKDHSGLRYGLLTVISEAGRNHRNDALWKCLCDCGKETVVKSCNLNNGYTRSCGCLVSKTNKRHGKTHQTEYNIWRGMKARCDNPNDAAYNNYGGRGVTVCDRWYVFDNFYSDMGNRPSNNHTIERKNTNGNYEPNNCVWATYQEQISNRRNTVKYVVLGVERTLARHCEVFQQRYPTVYARIQRGWSIEKALGLDELPRKNEE